ncbi:Chromosome partition protein smc [Geitlerinema sp. FC II]|nr:Chromosome partition protein smc [Geitlerinema sp. FC II]
MAFMVHIKQIELTNFKSFGGTTRIPFEPEFTVISGPNGSGKSNILDALLFCLGIASSKGMRADRLPDLVNQQQSNRKSTVEASVTVVFDLGDDSLPDTADEELDKPLASEGASEEAIDTIASEIDSPENENLDGDSDSQNSDSQHSPKSNEWTVTRRLRVTKSGSYTSTYYINGEPSTLTELHEKLNNLRVYPEGYNVVLQGDVTSIISMNPRERREIIDELAGVAAFDRKIDRAKQKFEEVEEREDRCRIVERELIAQRDRLGEDRIKAQKYQALRDELHQKQAWEIVLRWHQLRSQEAQVREQIEAGDRTRAELTEELSRLTHRIQTASEELDALNAKVRALGEDELIAQQSILAQQEAQKQQLQQRREELREDREKTQNTITQTEQNIQQSQQKLTELQQQQQHLETETLAAQVRARDEAKAELDRTRDAANALASTAEAWVQEQTQLRRETETLLKTLEPQRAERAQLSERVTQLSEQICDRQQSLTDLETQLGEKQQTAENLSQEETDAHNQRDRLESVAKAAEEELQIQQDTQTRLLKEQRDKQRKLDKLEAQTQAIREASGSYATQLVMQSGLSGVCGLVAQLGRVEPHYQMALETAAGGRLGFLVVEDDVVASAGIRLLKEKRAGRATFLPLNKIRAPRSLSYPDIERSQGFIDYAVNLLTCEQRYDEVFAYVFGNTVVFDRLDNARTVLGKARIVTLDGELLETSGAMTGGASRGNSSHLHFGYAETGESSEVRALRDRLAQIAEILERCDAEITRWATEVKLGSKAAMEAKQQHREIQLKAERVRDEIQQLEQQIDRTRSQLHNQRQELHSNQQRLQHLEAELPQQEQQLQQLREQLAELEKSHTHSEWQALQQQIQERETVLSDRTREVRQTEERVRELANQQERLAEKRQDSQEHLATLRQQLEQYDIQQTALRDRQTGIDRQLEQTQAAMVEIEAKLGEEKQTRDAAEVALRELRVTQQQSQWRLEKLQETQEGRHEQLNQVRSHLQQMQSELPEPLPEVPPNQKLDALQKELKAIAKRIEAMEPVNMLALEEFDRTQTRLEDLSEKLKILEGERSELMLRIENFTTLRLRAFREAFDAVNENFAAIFAELSQGDGHLQLNDEDDPFSSGLNLVAHPKGKPVQRLASMSGGEKSLTALSFIFALQRYRPSPFYAFDEVDMFLDGANVERLAKMIEKQAQHAQFMVVSLRRPMIASAERTIGVTQARGAHTQVLGLKLQHQQRASV